MMLDRGFQRRLFAIFLFLILLFAIVEWRLYSVQVYHRQYFLSCAENQHKKVVKLVPLRGEILDRNLNVLATSSRRNSVYVNSEKIKVKSQALATQLGQCLGLSFSHTWDLLNKGRDVPMARKISDQQAHQIQAIIDQFKLPHGALYFVREGKRLYPKKEIAAHLLGYTVLDETGDNQGAAGLELHYDKHLRCESKDYKAERSALRISLEPLPEEDVGESYGNSVVLTIDINIQEVAERAVRETVEKFEAKAGGAVVMRTKTGEVLAMASFPSYDANDLLNYPMSRRRNRCITDPFEPGSVMKIITASALLDSDKISPHDLIDCEGGRTTIDGRRISDAPGHTLSLAPFKEVICWSSNVGTCKAAQRLSPSELYQYLDGFGIGLKTGIDLPGESRGILRPVSRWTKLSMTSLPIGYEVAVTPIQLASAASSIGNQGRLMTPFVVRYIKDHTGKIIKESRPEEKRRIIQRITARQVLELMEGVVQHGTGKSAKIKGYRISGKTGTTLKSHIQEHREYIASFVGLIPTDDPELTIFVFVDAPKGQHYASEVAAPLFRQIAEETLSYLAIPPQESSGEETLVAQEAEQQTNQVEPEIEKDVAEGQLGKMPNLQGLTMKEALGQLYAVGQHGLNLEFIGSGVVVEQKPEPGKVLQARGRCLLVFEDPTVAY